MNAIETLSDDHWRSIERFFSEIPTRRAGKAHAPWRIVANSIFLILRSGMKWSAIPQSDEFASKTVANRWYRRWKQSGFLDRLLQALPDISPRIIPPPERNRLFRVYTQRD